MHRTIDELTEAAEQRWKAAWAQGPTRLRWAGAPPQIGDLAPDATLSDHDDNEVLVSSLWAQRPLLLLFWRHFGCSCGIDRAARLREELEGYRAAGATWQSSDRVNLRGRPATANSRAWRFR